MGARAHLVAPGLSAHWQLASQMMIHAGGDGCELSVPLVGKGVEIFHVVLMRFERDGSCMCSGANPMPWPKRLDPRRMIKGLIIYSKTPDD